MRKAQFAISVASHRHRFVPVDAETDFEYFHGDPYHGYHGYHRRKWDRNRGTKRLEK
jgi:hypothetical protein